LADSAAPRPVATQHQPSAFWPTLWLALVLVAPDATWRGWADWVRDLSVSAYQDVLFAVGLGLSAQLALRLARGRPRLTRAVWIGFQTVGVVCALYAVVAIKVFAYLHSPLTYPLIYLASDMTSMSSSLGTFVSAGLVVGLVVAPLAFLFGAWFCARRAPALGVLWRGLGALLLVVAIVWAWRTSRGRWLDRDDHLIVASPHWSLLASCTNELLGGHAQALDVPFTPEDLGDFEGPPPGRRRASRFADRPRPRNLVVIVLESTGAQYLSLYGSPYPTTPSLLAEAEHAAVFDRAYCHVGLTANSLAAMMLSIYPYMTWREYTMEYPTFPGTTLAQLMKARGARTAFLYSGDLAYTNEIGFLQNRGYDTMKDWAEVGGRRLSSWGGEDSVLMDNVLRYIDDDRTRPFYVTVWTMESHHPYEPPPDLPLIDFFKGRPLPPDDYDLGRYLNTIHHVDAQLGRLFTGLRERGLADDTLVVITGDHGEAFGDPHQTWGHGARVYDENVRVPFVVWNPRLFPKGVRLQTVGGHVDLNPTVADVMGLDPPASWKGRSLFDPTRPPRAYFYAANDDYLLGVREGDWKYVYNSTQGREDLYHLTTDPQEKKDLAAEHPERCARLQRRLAAWRDHVGRELAALR
jgi:arylsulfatase A-like enzyme